MSSDSANRPAEEPSKGDLVVASSGPTKPGRHESRPEFMTALGLLPPYSLEDVKQAYLAKVKELHPDRRGDSAAFERIQEAYEQAQLYVIFRGDRRGWIARRVEEYLVTEEVIKRLREYGAEVETRAVQWLEKSFGDFAELTESIVGVRLDGADNGDEVIGYMVGQHDRLLKLRSLSLAGCKVSDVWVRQLSVFRSLTNLDLSRTPITWESLHIVEWLPALESINVDGTNIRWWTRRKLQARMRRKRKLAAAARAIHPTRLR